MSTIEVSIAYGDGTRVFYREMIVSKPCTIEGLINQSGLPKLYPDEDFLSHKVGVWGQLKLLDYVLEAGDRVEVYRPLAQDPKARRRQKAKSDK